MVVVSEETGQISVAVEGHFHRRLDEADLRGHLNRYILVSSGE